MFKKLLNRQNSNSLNLNIGSGSYFIDGFISLDVYSENYYKSKDEFNSKCIEYNIITDQIPFQEGIVKNIYCSHVIEHLETNVVKKFIEDCYRVLKKDGVLRIATPDSHFLYNVSKFKNNYWDWRRKWFSRKNKYISEKNEDQITMLDYLTRELCTARLRFRERNIDELKIEEAFDNLSYKEFVEQIKQNLKFDINNIGDHINNWDFDRLKIICSELNFSKIINSKYRGSVSSDMQSESFDKTAPQMSLYVDFVK